MLFREKCHFIGFPFKVNLSELEVRISTVLSKNKIQGKGFRALNFFGNPSYRSKDTIQNVQKAALLHVSSTTYDGNSILFYE